jgi:site-specific DNA recombinase
MELEEYQRRGETLAEHVRQLHATVDQVHALEHLVCSITGFCERVQQGLAGASFEQQRNLVELLVDRVVVNNEDVEIRYVIPTTASSEHTYVCQLRSDYRTGESVSMMERRGCFHGILLSSAPYHNALVGLT